MSNDIIGESEDNNLSNKGLRDAGEKPVKLLNILTKSTCEVTDVLCFRNYLSGNYNVNLVKSSITKMLFCVYLGKLKSQTT